MQRRATYRLQLHPGFTFADAEAAIPYLVELGISHLYLSPVLQAAHGSTHGYDVVDHEHVARDLGGEAGFAALAAAAKRAGLGILLDIVPNHMSIAGTGNRWWLDVLENGPASFYAHCFDVDWTSDDDRVLLPVLGERYGRALTSGAISIGAFFVRVHDLALPLSPRSIGAIVKRAGERSGDAELQFIGDALAELPAPRDVGARRRRHRDKAVLMKRLAELMAPPDAEPEPRVAARCGAASINAELAAFATDPAALDQLLEAQNYRLAHWSVAGSDLGYRRFFDVATLVGLRVEDPDVVEQSHGRIFGWLADGTIDGVRVDHVDGLRDPEAYLRLLRERAPDAWIVVEKILAHDETLPTSWPVDGTTGYDFAEHASALFVDPAGEAALTEAFTAYTGEAWDPVGERRRARKAVLADGLHSELSRLVELARRACAQSPSCRDFTRGELEHALAEILAGYPRYRTYGEREPIAVAIAAVPAEIDRDLLGFLEAALAGELATPESRALAAAMQQTSGPVVAKGDEDTLAYRQVRLLARCEVGADLGVLSTEPWALHGFLARGRGLLATSTHDTKRSADVRMRIAAISEHAAAWAEHVHRWGERAARAWGGIAPDRILEYQVWQTLVGAWPLPIARAQAFAHKAGREAMLRTSWRRPDAAYEAAREAWLAGVYADVELIAEIGAFAARLAPAGELNALALVLLELTAPGVPDLYQGTELRDDSLVDPDNRRPVDLAARRALLRGLREVPTDPDARKLWLISRALRIRPMGAYRPVIATGPHAHRVFAFARDEETIAVVPRLSARAEGWRDTVVELPAGRWRDALTDRLVEDPAVAAIWRQFPVALLVRV